MFWNAYKAMPSIWVRNGHAFRHSKPFGVGVRNARVSFPRYQSVLKIEWAVPFRCGDCNGSWYEDPNCPDCGEPGTLLDKRHMG